LKKILEIAVFSAEAGVIASRSGADRLELCSAYAEGGLTPSLGTLRFVKEHATCPVFVMIRPRGGDFCYSDMEIEVMKHDILHSKEAGADGIVFGILNKDFTINENATRTLVQLAHPLPVTFHRAFDICHQPLRALETLIACGVKRILTSGQKSSAVEGAEFVAELNRKSKGRIVIMPGAGINSGNIIDLVKSTGCSEFHASAKRISTSSDAFGFGENVLPHPEIIAELKEKLLL
jgi:copper homeostasis protein